MLRLSWPPSLAKVSDTFCVQPHQLRLHFTLEQDPLDDVWVVAGGEGGSTVVVGVVGWVVVGALVTGGVLLVVCPVVGLTLLDPAELEPTPGLTTTLNDHSSFS